MPQAGKAGGKNAHKKQGGNAKAGAGSDLDLFHSSESDDDEGSFAPVVGTNQTGSLSDVLPSPAPALVTVPVPNSAGASAPVSAFPPPGLCVSVSSPPFVLSVLFVVQRRSAILFAFK